MTVKELKRAVRCLDDNEAEVVVTGAYASEGEVFNVYMEDGRLIIESDICSG